MRRSDGFGVRVTVVEPSFYATDIYGPDKRKPVPADSPYAAAVAEFDARAAGNVANGGDPIDVAHAIVAAVDDPLAQPRIVVGDGAKLRWGVFVRAQAEAWEAGEPAPTAI